MNETSVYVGDVGVGRSRLKLPVDTIAGLHQNLFTLTNFENWLDIGMVAVVAVFWLFRQCLRSIDADFVHQRFLPNHA